MLFGLTYLQLHLAIMASCITALIILGFGLRKAYWPTTIAGLCVFVCAVIAIRSLERNSDVDTSMAVLRSALYGAALGEHNLVIRDREYRLTRIPRDEDDLDNDDVDLNPEIPI